MYWSDWIHFWFKMHLLFKEISNHLRFVASFHIDKDIAKTTWSGISELKTAIIILFTVITVILFNLAPILCVRQHSCLLQCRGYSLAKKEWVNIPGTVQDCNIIAFLYPIWWFGLILWRIFFLLLTDISIGVVWPLYLLLKGIFRYYLFDKLWTVGNKSYNLDMG